MRINGTISRSSLICLPIFLFPFLLFSETLLSGRALFWGTPSLQFIPWRAYAYQLISQGELPLWNSLNGMGTPLAANYQLAIFYPPGWLLYLFWKIGGVPWMAWAHTLLAVIHLAWAGFGMARLGRFLGFSPLGQSVCGVTFGLCGYFVARLGFFSMIWGGAWLPWVILYTSYVAYPGESPGDLKKHISIKLIFSISMQLLAGHAQLAWYTFILAGFWVIVGGWGNGGIKTAISSLGHLLVGIMISFLCSAIQLIPTAEFLGLSQRSNDVNFDSAMTYSFWPWRILTLIAPDLFGNPGRGTYWGYASHWEDAIYVGLLPFLAAMFAIFSLKNISSSGISRQYRSMILFLCILSISGIILALGINTPLFPFLYKYIPTFDMFNAPARYMVWVEFSLALLSGIGITLWEKPISRRLYWLRLSAAGGAAISIGALFAWLTLKSIKTTLLEAATITGFWALGTLLIAVFTPLKTDNKRYMKWCVILILWVGADLIFADWYLNPSIDKNFYESPLIVSDLIQGEGINQRIYMNQAQEYSIMYKEFFTFNNFKLNESWDDLRNVKLANINILDNAPSVNNFDPLLTKRYVNWIAALEKLPFEERYYWLAMMNVKLSAYESLYRPISVRFPSAEISPSFFKWYQCAHIVRNDQESYQLIKTMMQTPAAADAKWVESIVIEDLILPEGLQCTPASIINVQLPEYSPRRLRIKVSTSGEGWLLISDSWFPGWRAYLDGKKIELYPGNYIFKAVNIPPGEHELSINYSPISYIIGGCISFLTVIILAIVLITRCLKKHRTT